MEGEGFARGAPALAPDAARDQLRDAIGSYEIVVDALAPRLHERANEILGRDFGYGNALSAAKELVKSILRPLGAGGWRRAANPARAEPAVVEANARPGGFRPEVE